VLLRFELSPKGRSYMHLPWFARRGSSGWQQPWAFKSFRRRLVYFISDSLYNMY
jgi:hypothetical protein